MADLSSKDARSTLSFGPELPYRMGRYTLCEELGAGGMATVYLSKMRLAAGLERSVAIKTIHAHLAKQQSFVDMFLDEAKIASHISHPNVCAVYDFGDVQGLYYIAMEYLVGAPLIEVANQVVESGDDELLDVVPFLSARIIADAAEGLHAAHTLKGADGKPLRVIHRDVSPQNLFVTYEGSVKVVDFGCAKALERVTQTNTGVMKGKVAYAAPEQLQGSPDVDARLDVFALGVCLWECLTLRNLFRRENAILTAQAVLGDDIPRADEGNDWVPPELADIAEKALQRNKEDRYTTAREMGRALRAFIASSGTVFESAEVADVMERLFSDRHANTLRRLEALQRVEVSQVGPVSAPEIEIRSAADSITPDPETVPPPARARKKQQDAIGEATTTLAKTPAKVDEPNVWDIGGDEDPVVLPTRTGRYAAIVLFLAALIGGGVYAYMFHRAPIFEALGIELEGPSVADEDGDGTSVTPEGTSDEGTSDEGTTDEGTTDEGTTDDGTTDEGTTDEGATDEGATDEGATDEGTTDEGTSVAGAEPPESTRGRRRRAQEAESGGTTTVSGSETPTPPADPDPPADTTATEENIVRPSRTLDFSRGTIVVRAHGGWAIVEHQGRRLGRTPVRAELPIGHQTLRILPYGNGPGRSVGVDVAWGEAQQITIEVPVQGETEGWDNPY